MRQQAQRERRKRHANRRALPHSFGPRALSAALPSVVRRTCRPSTQALLKKRST
jgi:hypothetical protein